MATYKWRLLKAVPRGHRYFVDENTGKLAIADQSGDGASGQMGFPHETEDGVLWVVRDRPIRLSGNKHDAEVRLFLSLSNKQGDETITIINVSELFYLVATFNMEVKVHASDGSFLPLVHP